MALLSFFPGSQVPLSIAGLMRKVNYNDADSNLEKKVHVIIPVKNEEKRIPYALGSILKQDYKNLELTVVNNLSSDRTYEVSKKLVRYFPERYRAIVLDNKEPGKTPSIKLAMRAKPNRDLTFILDADTYLTDSNYVSTLAAQFNNPQVGSAYGTVKPIRTRNAKKAYKSLVTGVFSKADNSDPELNAIIKNSKPKKMINPLNRMIVAHRASLYSFDQNFIKRGQMGLYGTTIFPVGCGVMYNTKLLGNIFSEYEESLGDNLTTSEDIFLGFAIRDKGKLNRYVPGIHMETAEPTISKYFKQNKAWSSSFIQNAFYFKDHTFRMFSAKGEKEKAMGASILFPLIEKVAYPACLGYFAATGKYDITLAAIGLEMAVHTVINFCSAEKGYKIKSVTDTLVSEPIRFSSFFSELYTCAVFVKDLITHNREWRK